LGGDVGLEWVVEEELAVPVVEIMHHPQPDLVRVSPAIHPPRRLADALHGREEKPDQDGNDRDDDQQLDEREP
jgi:hypothetical protein